MKNKIRTLLKIKTATYLIILIGLIVFNLINSNIEAQTMKVLVVAGGGGGGGGGYNGGGGGAGGFLYEASHAITAQTYSIIVGSGGAGSSNTNSKGTNGSNSIFDSMTAFGGGGGGSEGTATG
ncbi:MAG: hypothetical protein HGB12_12635, partial [Bacteroidetes bacterium]|nr:hypothetical protein [Bacteroidota bacterium]